MRKGGSHHALSPTILWAQVNKIPAVTIWFWLIKTMITGADVAWPDYLYQRLGQLPVSGMICLTLSATLVAQFRVRSYRAWVFWPAVIAVSVAGTEAANGLYDELGLSYSVIAAEYLVLLTGLIAWWQARERTVSLRQVHTLRREAFYWAVALTAFALGTATSHITLVSLLTRPMSGPWIWAALIGCVTVAWKWLGLNPALAFWACYVLTRPLGTSIALLLSDARNKGGLGLGQWPVSVAFASGVIILVTYLAVRAPGCPGREPRNHVISAS